MKKDNLWGNHYGRLVRRVDHWKHTVAKTNVALTGARATAGVSTGGRSARALCYVAVLPKENANVDRQEDKKRQKREKYEVL